MSAANSCLRVLCLVGLVAAALNAAPTIARAQVPFELVAKPNQAYKPAGSIEVVRNEAELQALWHAIAGRGAAPAVNFKNRMVIAYFMGPRSDSGGDLNIDGVAIRGGELKLRIRQFESCGGGQFPEALGLLVETIRWPGPVGADTQLEGCHP